jgi:hypothetical protein
LLERLPRCSDSDLRGLRLGLEVELRRRIAPPSDVSLAFAAGVLSMAGITAQVPVAPSYGRVGAWLLAHRAMRGHEEGQGLYAPLHDGDLRPSLDLLRHLWPFTDAEAALVAPVILFLQARIEAEP